MNTTIDIAQFQARRARLLSIVNSMVNKNAIVIIPSAQEVTRSNDTEYSFRQNSDFYYLTGFNEPDCFLVLSNKGLTNSQSSTHQSTLFLRPKDDSAEIWHGRRLGITDAPKNLLVDTAYSIEDIDEILPDMLDGHDYLFYSLSENLHADDLVQSAMAICKNAPKQSKQAPSSIVDVSQLVHAMRLIKSAQEISLMQQSADISCKAHKAAMALCKPGVYEYQLEATILHSFAMQGARYAAYNTIVGGGENACVLHYIENKDVLLDGDLVLIDAGSEYQGYAADITRTFPVNGRFSPAQTEIYNLVLSTQLACINQ
ncbi:MAG: Xaa-Pro aminopeptidase, partial [Gammaproteobacteria bacterium]